MRRAVALLLFAIASAAHAADAVAQSRSLVEGTSVTYPTRLGDYTLAGDAHSPEAVQLGLSLEYSVAGAPEGTEVWLYVYPHGRSDVAAAVMRGMDEIENSVRLAEAQSMYTEVRFGPRSEFVVDAPAPSILAGAGKRNQPIRQGTGPSTDLGTPDEAVATLSAPTTSVGQRQTIRFTKSGVATRSAGYVFYRNLYLFKVRIKSPVNSIGEAEFTKLADAAVRRLVPAVDVRNFGDCGTVVVDPVVDTDTDKGAISIVREMGRIQRENCDSSKAEPMPLPGERKRTLIQYAPGTWPSGNHGEKRL